MFAKRRSTDPWAALADQREGMDRRALLWGAGATVGLGIMGAAAFYAEQAQARAERDLVTLCRTRVIAPRATLVIVDQTDALAGGSSARFRGLMHRLKADLAQDARLLIVPFDGDLGRSPAPILDICSPGTGAEANELVESSLDAQRLYDERFLAELETISRELQRPHESPYSPIVQQIERIVSDPALNWRGSARELIVMTDGLQHMPDARIYAGQAIALPPPAPDLLDGVTVRYVELANPLRSDLQTPAVRAAWQSWFEAAGANVRMYAPGYSESGP